MVERSWSRALVFAGVALPALIAGVPALAAEAQPAAAGGAVSSEVIVTAQRRSERLSEVPIAITAQTGEQLTRAAVTNIRDLTTVTPGLRFGTSVNALPTIRGVYSRQTDPGNDPNISLYVDGVYQANVIANNFELVDIDRVEVLKGPQGTLFGRNATGGAIRIFTRSPSFTPMGFVDASYGNYDAAGVRAYVTGPLLGDKVAASLSGAYERADGFDENLLTGKRERGTNNKSIRLKLLAQPTEALTANLMLGYVDRYDTNLEGWNTFNGNSIGRSVPGAVIATEPHTISPNVDPYQRNRIYTAALSLALDTGVGTFTSLTAYNKTAYLTNQDADFSSADLLNYRIAVNQRDFSQELNFASKRFGMFQLTAGAFLFDSTGRYEPLEIFGATAPLYGFMEQKTTAYAGFGEVTIEPIERLTLLAGLRYSDETREAFGLYTGSPNRPDLPQLGKASFDSATPRASIRYTFETGDNVYFTFSKGFKSGGFNIAGLSRTPFQPEKLTAYEVGLKTAPVRVLAANLSAFYYDYKNQQVQAFVGGLNVTTNAAASHIYGADADITWRPIPQLTLTTGLAYLHARYESFPGAVFNVPTGNPPCLCGNVTIGDSPDEQGPLNDLSGRRLPDAPTFTVSATATYREDYRIGQVELSGSIYHTSAYFVDSGDRIEQSPYTTLALRASLKPAGTPWTVYAWGKNLTDEEHFAAAFVANAGDGVVWAPPRTFGIGARFDF